MKTILKRIIIGALAVSVPVGGTIFYLSTQSNSNEKEKNNSSEVDNKKDDDVNRIPTDAKDTSSHKERIELFRDSYDNDEVVAVLSIPNSSLDVAVVQHEDNDYYLNHDADKTEKIEGSVFLDYRSDVNSGRKNIIYGHNGNEDCMNVPFAELEKYYDKAYFDNHQFIKLEDEEGVGTYQIFSVYVETNGLDYMLMNFDKEGWIEHLSYLKNNSLYNTNVDVDASDELLILQTCSHNEDYAKYKDKYLLVVAKRVRYE